MLKHRDVIVNLSLDEKLAILTDGSFFSVAREGLPTFSITDTEIINQASEETVFPSFQALMNTWDVNAVGYVAKQMAKRALDKEKIAIFLPKANVRGNAYSDGASEDPYLLGSFIGEYAKVMEEYGVTPVLSTCALSNLDVEYADVKPNAKALVEYYFNAFRIAMKGREHFAVSSSYTTLKGEYAQINVEFVRDVILRSTFAKGGVVLCEKNRRESELSCLQAGYTLCLNGNARILKDAIAYYKDLLDLVETGDASVEELETAVTDGIAVSEDVIDEAVDKVLEFVYGCLQYAKFYARSIDNPIENRALSLAERSAVLLKNEEGTLPLRGEQKVAVIGQIAKAEIGESFLEYMSKSSAKYVGYEDGYDLAQNQNKSLLDKAKLLAKKADVLVVCVGAGKQREQTLSKTKCLQLPGCQAALLEALASLNKRMVVIVKGSGRVDMQFDSLAHAVLYVSDMGSYGGKALARLLFGKACPSGRLPFTMYENVDERMQTERFYKNNGYNKVGTFVGYRRYDSDGERVKYHFGYGLSYTKFQYSNLRIVNNEIQVTIHNTGTREGTTVVQFYYGKTRALDVSPKKELFAAEVITLAAGKTMTVRKKLDNGCFSSYNSDTNAWELMRKKVRIYVGQSVADERLYCDYNVLGATEVKSKEYISEYLQGKSNIQVGGYFMDTQTKQEKYKDTATVVGLVTLLLGLIGDLFLLIFTGRLPFFKDIIGKWTLGILLFTFNVLLVVGIVSLVRAEKKKTDYKKKQTQRIALKRKTAAKEKTVAPSPYASLFLREFKDAEEEEEEENETEEAEEKSFVIQEETDEYHKDGWSLDAMRNELVDFLTARGIALDPMNARALLSAMSVSRLLIIQTENGVNREKFLRAIHDFFANKPYVDDASDYKTSDDLLYKLTDDGCQTTCFSDALETAAAEPLAMTLACLTNVEAAKFGAYTSQLMRYVVKPDLTHSIATKNKLACDKTYALKYNLWLLACLEDDTLADELPAYLAEAAVFVRLQFTEIEPQETELPDRQPISAKQFMDMVGKARANYELSEKYWKRVDKLEEYVQARAHYRISNKLWQKMESYASVFLALNGEPEQALDSVVASKMLLTVLTLIRNHRKEEDELFTHVIENIFGDEKSDCCRALAEASAVDMSETSRQEALEKTAYNREVRLGRISVEEATEEVEEVVDPETVATAEVVDPEVVETAEVVEPEVVETAEVVDPETVETAEVVEPEAVETAEVVEPEAVATAEVIEPATAEGEDA